MQAEFPAGASDFDAVIPSTALYCLASAKQLLSGIAKGGCPLPGFGAAHPEDEIAGPLTTTGRTLHYFS